jgi:BolA protein
MSLSKDIEKKLREGLQAYHVEVIDESAAHHGHAHGGGGHYQAIVVSPAFAGKPLVARHRMVNALLAEELKGAIHALALTTVTPEEWAVRKA